MKYAVQNAYDNIKTDDPKISSLKRDPHLMSHYRGESFGNSLPLYSVNSKEQIGIGKIHSTPTPKLQEQ